MRGIVNDLSDDVDNSAKPVLMHKTKTISNCAKLYLRSCMKSIKGLNEGLFINTLEALEGLINALEGLFINALEVL